MKRTTRLKQRNPERLERRRAAQFGAQAELCRALPCCACGAPPPSDPAHVRSRGAGGKDRECAPMCRTCHGLQHAHGFMGPFRLMAGPHGGPSINDALDPLRYGWNPPMVKLADCARAYFEHVARGLEAVVKLGGAS